jgi:putative ABC transport system permease protein
VSRSEEPPRWDTRQPPRWVERQPPRWVARCLGATLRPLGEVGESIADDLRSEWSALSAQDGRRRADRWYRRQAMGIVVRVVRDRWIGSGPFHPRTTKGARQRGREIWSMRGLLNEMRQVTRSLLRARQYAIAAVLTLALAVAANTIVFSVTNSILLEPLSYPEAGRLLVLRHAAPGLGYPRFGISPGLYYQYRENVTAIESSGLFATMTMNVTSPGSPPERVTALASTYTLFETLGITPVIGRGFGAEEDVPDAAGVVVLGHDFWQNRYGSNPSVIGSTVTVDGEDRLIVGVMPAGFSFPGRDMALWMPLRIDLATSSPGNFGFMAIARMRPSSTQAEVQTQLESVVGRLADAYPDQREFHAFLETGRFAPIPRPLKEDIVGDLRQPLLILLGTAGLVLLIACANVTNLFLVRAENRQRDVAVRSALGAGRGLLARVFLAESVLISTAAGVAGLAIGAIGIGSLVRLAPPNLPRIDEVAIRPTVVAYAAALTVVTALLLALIPALRMTRPAVLALVSRSGARTTAGRDRHRVRQVLVVVQTALAVVLLVGSGLMLRTFSQLRSIDPGFDADGVLTFRVSLPGSTYADAPAAARFHDRLLEQLRALPGVQSAGAITEAPLATQASGTAFAVEDHPVGADELNPMFWYTSVSQGYFETMKIPLLSGETFDNADREAKRRAIVISQSLAQRFWPGENPIGKRIRGGGDTTGEWSTVVGVAGNVHERRLQDEPGLMVYFPTLSSDLVDRPAGQPGRPPALSMTYVVRGSQPDQLGGAVRNAVWQLDPNLPIAAVNTMSRIVADSMVQISFTMLALVIAATLALFLGAIGLYGVISYIVSQRMREIGLRIALGANPASVRRMVVWQGFRLSVIGLGLGSAVALSLARLLGNLLYGTRPNDPLTFAAVLALLGFVGLVATWVPAMRAARVDPARTLNAD